MVPHGAAIAGGTVVAAVIGETATTNPGPLELAIGGAVSIICAAIGAWAVIRRRGPAIDDVNAISICRTIEANVKTHHDDIDAWMTRLERRFDEHLESHSQRRSHVSD